MFCGNDKESTGQRQRTMSMFGRCHPLHSLTFSTWITLLCTVFLTYEVWYRFIWQANLQQPLQRNPRYARAIREHKLSPAENTSNERSPVTVVTAYYQIPSKHSDTEYYRWMTNFLRNIPCFLYVFVDNATYPVVQKLRLAYANKTRLILLPFEKLEMYGEYGQFIHQKHLDPESYHTPELYIIWHEKPAFVLRAAQENAFESEFFIWCDIGSFRNPVNVPYLTTFPNSQKISQIGDAKMRFLSTFHFSNGSFVPYLGKNADTRWPVTIGGGILGGRIEAWHIWSKLYYEKLNYRLSHQLFAGKDQDVMMEVVMEHPETAVLIHPLRYYLGPEWLDKGARAGDPFFYLQYYWS